MGDRANILFVQSVDGQPVYGPTSTQDDAKVEGIYLYGHWAGANLRVHLRGALRHAKPRWDDPSYATRIMVSLLIPEGDHHRETGWGLSTFLTDNEYPITIVDFATQSVYEADEGQERDRKAWRNSETFEAFSTR